MIRMYCFKYNLTDRLLFVALLMFYIRYNIGERRGMEASSTTQYGNDQWSKEVAVMLSTILVGGAFVAVLAFKWKFYNDYYNRKNHTHKAT